MKQNYALIHDNKIVVGPRDYRPSVFQKYLDQNGIEFIMPDNYEGQSKLTINANVYMLPVNFGDIPSYDSYFYQLAGPNLTIKASEVTGTYSVAEQSIDTIKYKMFAELAERRYNQEVSDMEFDLNGETVIVMADRESRSTISQTLILSTDGETIPWKFKSGFKLISKTDLQAIAEAMKVHVYNAFAMEAAKQAEIQACLTVDELKLITDYKPNTNSLVQ